VAVPSGTQRWSEAWTRPATDLLAVQEEIARAVATAIAGQLLPQERSVLAARVNRDPEAYDRFLRGNFQLARRTPASVAGAIMEYESATRLDPSLAQAEARIALAYALYLDWGWDFPGLPRDSLLARGERAADRALALDTLSADAWMVRGYIRSLRFPRSLDGVLPALERATLLDPRNAEAWHQYGWMLWSVGRREEAEAATRRALALEPGRTISWGQLGNILESLGRDDDARVAYDSATDLDPEFYASWALRTWVRLRAGDVQGAQRDAETAQRVSPPGEAYFGTAPLAAVAAYRGDTVTARRIMEQAVAPFATRTVGPFAAQMLARGLIAAGRPEEAVALMERTVPLGALVWAWLHDPAFDSIRHRERFEQLLAATRPEGAR
jgi:tetratricopeptide (TPR) repeat protein